jgi:signal transduction histidine kinase
MELFLCVIIFVLLITVWGLAVRQFKTKKELEKAASVVEEIAAGNMDRRLIINEKSPAAPFCYTINHVIIRAKAELSRHKQSEKAYRQLITSLSHDIRTPLASLTGYLEAIRLGLVSGEDIEQYVEVSHQKALDLKYYVDTLFEWLKLESGERIYHFERINIFEYLRELVADLIPQFEKANMEYDIAIPEKDLTILTDKSALRRVADNLMQNALIHSHASLIKVEARELGDMVLIEISDNGIGISEVHLPHIFERLYKCNTARGVSGNGLGLSIVKELVKGLAGEITVKSKGNIGTSFCVSLPALNC